MIRNQFGTLVTPSWVHYGDAILAIGGITVELAHRFPHMGDTIFGVKRYLGLNVSEAVREVTHLVMTGPATKKTIIRAESYDKSFQGLYPEYIAGIIVVTVKKTAELYLGSKITSAVISVPGVYGKPQRQEIIDASTIGGFKSIRLINDPTSIALAYW